MTTANSIRDAQEAPTPAHLAALHEATHETLSLGDSLLFLADSEHDAMPSGLAHMLRALAERAHGVGCKLDGIKLTGGGNE